MGLRAAQNCPESDSVSILVIVEYWFGGSMAIPTELLTPWFQSLLSWNTDLGNAHIGVYQNLNLLFQSLLSWNTDLGSEKPVPLPWKEKCFNPCYRGILIWGQHSASPKDSLVLFQSLLSWNTDLGCKRDWSTTVRYIVSILVIVEYWFGEGITNGSHYQHVKFQSLLSWNTDLGSGRVSLLRSSTRCFNPCYRGILIWGVFYVYRLKRQ